MNETYRDKLNKRIDESWIFTTRKQEWSIRLDRWFYITRDLIQKTLFSTTVPMEYFHNPNMGSFAQMVWISRQAVRDSVINNWKFIFLRKWYYNKDWLLVFLNNFINKNYEK